MRWKRSCLAGLLACILGLTLAAPAAAAETTSAGLGAQLPWWSAIPFAGLLLSIALFPLFAPHFWHQHYPKVALAWGLILAAPFLWAYGGVAVHELLHVAILDYIPFIILLSTLFVIGGGIYIRASLQGSPEVNTAILVAGTLLASWIGTTGAAMLLIRPLLRANANRKHKVHSVVFFIFLVANIGGTLTPLGDPPLFLGFLRGVPFFWTFTLFTEFLVISLLVLTMYYVLDRYYWQKEDPEVRRRDPGERMAMRIEGLHNFGFLLGVLAAVAISGLWFPGEVSVLGIPQGIQNLLRDGFLLLMMAGSWWATSPAIRKENGYTWGPIKEVVVLFAAIFATIIPVLAILKAGEQGALASLVRFVQTPAEYFWMTGGLSTLLDNAPTYLTFLSTALGRFYPDLPEREAIARLIAENGIILKAISTGAVFMGANTYISNAPNFMVRAIAEEAGYEMPTFFGFVFRFVIPFLLPAYLVVTWIFFL